MAVTPKNVRDACGGLRQRTHQQLAIAKRALCAIALGGAKPIASSWYLKLKLGNSCGGLRQRISSEFFLLNVDVGQ
ncbi:MAG: hypothetical protein ACREPR_08575 [Brasilonema sp.]